MLTVRPRMAFIIRDRLVWFSLFLVLMSLMIGGTRAVEAAGYQRAARPFRCIRDSVQAAGPHLMAAAAARFASISACYPLDTIKTRLQLGGATAAERMKDGISGLYVGLGGSLFGQVPYGMLSFGSYEMYKAALLKRCPGVPRVMTFCAAACLGDLTGNLWLVPFEVVKVQMQGGMHASLSAATLSIFRTSGVGGFYKGFGGQVVRDVPFRAIQLSTYELLRTMVTNWRAKTWDASSRSGGEDGGGSRSSGTPLAVSPGDAALLGGVAGAVASVVTCPLDVVRTRLMAGEPATGTKGVSQTWAGAIKAGGLYAGIGTRVIYIGISGAVFFVVYEAMKTHFLPSVYPAASAGDGSMEKTTIDGASKSE